VLDNLAIHHRLRLKLASAFANSIITLGRLGGSAGRDGCPALTAFLLNEAFHRHIGLHAQDAVRVSQFEHVTRRQSVDNSFIKKTENFLLPA